ncbi:hypothetical protein AB0J55_00540 [Amycolatopsis sp. NPDC049688]|uniref:hypothetical protein n=1 Tax=Amycolatopsis sp. NPDC049688 TaxID=3154733 RepID=UPI00341E0908
MNAVLERVTVEKEAEDPAGNQADTSSDTSPASTSLGGESTPPTDTPGKTGTPTPVVVPPTSNAAPEITGVKGPSLVLVAAVWMVGVVGSVLVVALVVFGGWHPSTVPTALLPLLAAETLWHLRRRVRTGEHLPFRSPHSRRDLHR